jgi:phage shock protein E
MMKPSQKQNRPLVLLAFAVLSVILGTLAWISIDNLGTREAQPAQSQLISPTAYKEQFKGDTTHILVDVRTPEEFNTGHIAGSININVETLANRLDEIPEDQPIVVYCRSGNRSATAANILVNAGFSPVYDLGGIQTWVDDGFPIE